MAYYGVHWTFDGVGAACVRRGRENGQYAVLFERDSAELPAIETVNWAEPTIEHLTDQEEFCLPEGYGFEVADITYDHSVRAYTVELKTATQYLGDVTGYQEEIEGLNATVAEKDSTISAQAAQIQEQTDTIAAQETQIQEQAAAIEALEEAGSAADLQADLDAAYQEGVDSVE